MITVPGEEKTLLQLTWSTPKASPFELCLLCLKATGSQWRILVSLSLTLRGDEYSVGKMRREITEKRGKTRG